MISKCKGSYLLLFCQIFSWFLLLKNVSQKEQGLSFLKFLTEIIIDVERGKFQM